MEEGGECHYRRLQRRRQHFRGESVKDGSATAATGDGGGGVEHHRDAQLKPVRRNYSSGSHRPLLYSSRMHEWKRIHRGRQEEWWWFFFLFSLFQPKTDVRTPGTRKTTQRDYFKASALK